MEKLNRIPYDVYIHLESDGIIAKEDARRRGLVHRKGKIYTKDEINEIREKLDLITSRINLPPENVKDREKIIYAQIVKQLSRILEYDNRTADIIEQEVFNGHGIDKDKQKMVDSSQNLKGLLQVKENKNGATVCAGYSRIIQSLCRRYNISCETISENKHAWNLLRLDDEIYEDDFTWYEENLKLSNISKINTFLKGKDVNGKREFENLEYHEINRLLTLSNSLPEHVKNNLLTTDWEKITDWGNIDINVKPQNLLSSIITKKTNFFKRILDSIKSKILYKKVDKISNNIEGVGTNKDAKLLLKNSQDFREESSDKSNSENAFLETLRFLTRESAEKKANQQIENIQIKEDKKDGPSLDD